MLFGLFLGFARRLGVQASAPKEGRFSGIWEVKRRPSGASLLERVAPEY